MAKQQQDEATLANARLDLTRYQALARQEFAPQQQVDTQQALVAQDIAALAGDEAMVEFREDQSRLLLIASPIPGRVGLRLVCHPGQPGARDRHDRASSP